MKKILVVIMSLGLIACNDSGDKASSDASREGAVYGVDYEYDGTHPEEITVDEKGTLEPFIISMADVVEECGKKFFKSPVTGDVFNAVEINGAWHAEQIGWYSEYDPSFASEFQVLGYQARQMVSVGKYVVMSAHPGLSQYFDWNRINYQDVAAHDNCMVIIDEANQDVLAVDLTNDTTSSIF